MYVKAVPHMMMVVGWGPLLLSWDEIDSFDYSTLLDSYPPDTDASYGHVVPYLIDHGPHGETERVAGSAPIPMCSECTNPRPYYTLYWPRYRVGANHNYTVLGLDPIANDPYFIHIPETLTPVPVENIKKPPVGRDQIQLQ